MLMLRTPAKKLVREFIQAVSEEATLQDALSAFHGSGCTGAVGVPNGKDNGDNGNGSSGVPISIADWTLTGIAQRVNKQNVQLDLTARMELGDDQSQLIISLSADDAAYLDAGTIVFEVVRVSPSLSHVTVTTLPERRGPASTGAPQRGRSVSKRSYYRAYHLLCETFNGEKSKRCIFVADRLSALKTGRINQCLHLVHVLKLRHNYPRLGWLPSDSQSLTTLSNVLAPVFLYRFSNSRPEIISISILVRYCDFRNYEGRRLCLCMKALNRGGTERETCEHCECNSVLGFHDVLPES
jgi:hypothetical protein